MIEEELKAVQSKVERDLKQKDENILALLKEKNDLKNRLENSQTIISWLTAIVFAIVFGGIAYYIHMKGKVDTVDLEKCASYYLIEDAAEG